MMEETEYKDDAKVLYKTRCKVSLPDKQPEEADCLVTETHLVIEVEEPIQIHGLRIKDCDKLISFPGEYPPHDQKSPSGTATLVYFDDQNKKCKLSLEMVVEDCESFKQAIEKVQKITFLEEYSLNWKSSEFTDEGFEGFEFQTSQNGEITIGIDGGELFDFIGDGTYKYLTKFRKFNANGHDKFAFTWHWSAFCFSVIWMFYRKLYVWALVGFFLSVIPFLYIPVRLVLGLTGNYLYYKHTKKKILNLKKTKKFSDSTQMAAALKKTGGVNIWVVIAVVILEIALRVLYVLYPD